jgi:hypothetical protein
MPSIVQFFHPGIEHLKINGKIRDWNNEPDHYRKYLISKGNYIENNEEKRENLLFWGEWEPTSYADIPTKPTGISLYEKYPEYLHTPYIPPKDKMKSYQGKNKNYQNTDPFVFGEKFKYSICMQDAYPDLKNLDDGSIILFGSCVNKRFAIDTIFVVNGVLKYNFPEDDEINNFITESKLYKEIVLKMACGDSNFATTLTLYTGATFKDNINGMYSFVPSIKYNGEKRGFSRIIMPDEFYTNEYRMFNRYFSKWDLNNGRIYERKNEGVKITPGISLKEIKSFWEYLKSIVLENNCVLGYNFEMPMEYDIFQLNKTK